MARVDDVAAAIIEFSDKPVDPLKLQKLLYYAQAWHLVWYSEPLFGDEIQAWREGPAVYSVWSAYQGCGRSPIQHPVAGNAGGLSIQEQNALRAVLRAYGGHSGLALRNLTHQEDPWVKAREGLARGDISDRPISTNEMARYYQEQGVFGGGPMNLPELPDDLVEGVLSGDDDALNRVFQEVVGAIPRRTS